MHIMAAVCVCLMGGGQKSSHMCCRQLIVLVSTLFFLEKGVKQAGINSIIRTYVYSLYLNYIYVDLFVTLFSFERMEAFINLEVTG